MENLQAFSARAPRTVLFTFGKGSDRKKRRDPRCGHEASGGPIDTTGQAPGGHNPPPQI